MINTIKEFEGIIGALLGSAFGVVTTLITTKWLESWGKLQYYVSKEKIKYYKSDGYGGHSIIKPKEVPTYIECEFRIEIYNNSNIIKSIKDIKVLIATENNCIEKNISDKSTYRLNANRNIYDELLFINCTPKEIMGYDLVFSIGAKKFINNKVEEIKEIYFIAKDLNGKKVEIEVYKVKAK